MDVNKVLAEALEAGGLTCPMCEEPYQGNAQGTYITWEHLGTEERFCSGKVYRRTHRLQLTLWFDPDDRGWRQTRDAASLAIGLYAGRSSSGAVQGMAYGLRGLEDVPAIERKRTSMMVVLWEVV